MPTRARRKDFLSAEWARATKSTGPNAVDATTNLRKPAGQALSVELMLARKRIDPFLFADVILADRTVMTVASPQRIESDQR